jgi:sterol desaturase/sphingolipid hydroxylase (fatty acid hydroxylase superfamily)
MTTVPAPPQPYRGAAIPPPPAPYRPAPDGRPPLPPPYVGTPAGSADRATFGGGTLALIVTGLLVALAIAVHSTVVFGIVALAAVFIPLERLVALHPQRVLRRMWKTDLVHLLVNNILSTVGLVILVAAPVVLAREMFGTGVAHAVSTQPFVLQFVEALLLTETIGYWYHRASHQIPFLWRFHKVHHSIEEMDWLASGRLHPLDQIFGRACLVLPLFVLGFGRATFGAYLFLATLWAIFVHSNVRLTFGPLRWIVITPNYHHWHHTNDPDAINHNFAGQLPLLDVIFGTCHQPLHQWPASYGIDEQIPETYLGQLAWPFHRDR